MRINWTFIQSFECFGVEITGGEGRGGGRAARGGGVEEGYYDTKKDEEGEGLNAPEGGQAGRAAEEGGGLDCWGVLEKDFLCA